MATHMIILWLAGVQIKTLLIYTGFKQF